MGAEVLSDDSLIHPPYFCASCYLAAKRICGSPTTYKPKSLVAAPVEWVPHNDTFCEVCDVYCKGGRPKKSARGRPNDFQQHIASIAVKVPGFSLSQIVDKSCKPYVTCTFCEMAANKPIRILPCQSIVCYKCCTTVTSNEFECHGCSSRHDSLSATFTELSSLEQKMLKDMKVKCEKCDRIVKLEKIDEACENHGEENPAVMTLQEVIHQPLVVKPSKLESQAAIRVVSRMIHQNDGTTCKLPTGGRVRLHNICMLYTCMLHIKFGQQYLNYVAC